MQSGDIWSYGCVLSEAAVWLGGGYEELLNYRSGLSAAELSRKIDSDYRFDDGKRILPTIFDAHDLLRGQLHFRYGTTTDTVLRMIEVHILLEDPYSRLAAYQLVRKADALIEEIKRSSISRGDTWRPYPPKIDLWRDDGHTVEERDMSHPASLMHEVHMPKLIYNLSGKDRKPQNNKRFGTDASIGASQATQTPQDINFGTEEQSKGKARLDPQVAAKTTSTAKKRAAKRLPVVSINEAFEWKRAKTRVGKRDHVRPNPPPF
jgi:hypothetical protein